MAKIECTAGYAETPVGGMMYVFQRDSTGRFVAEVYNEAHIAVLLSVEHYRHATDEAPGKGSLREKLETTTAPPPPVPPVLPMSTADAAAADDVPGGSGPATPPGPRHPLDHDGDGRKGGSLPATERDALTRIRGVASATADKLRAEGIATIVDVAALDEERIAALDDKLGLHGRITRDKWVEQARALLATSE